MADVKVGIYERDGVELPLVEEHELIAGDIPFDNTGTEIIADKLQGAVVEASESGALALSLPRYALSSVHNSSLQDNQLVGVSNLVNVPVVVPIKSVLKEITFYQGGGASRDGEYEFYNNTQSAPNLFFTWTLNNTTTAVVEEGVDYTSPVFNAGDLLLIYFNDTGSNHSDVSLHYLFQAVE